MHAVLVAPPPESSSSAPSDAAAGRDSDRRGAKPLAEEPPAAAAASAADGAPASPKSAPEAEASTGGAELMQRFSSLWEEMEQLLCPLCDAAGARTPRQLWLRQMEVHERGISRFLGLWQMLSRSHKTFGGGVGDVKGSGINVKHGSM